MADVETRIKIKADAKEAQKAGKDLEKAFTPKAMEALSKATKELEKRLVEIGKRQKVLAAELGKTDKGTAAYTKLNRELGKADKQFLGVTKQVTALAKAHQQLGNIVDQQDRKEQQRAQRTEAKQRQQRGRSFFGGLMQGSGIAQYFPAEPGQLARTAGIGVGSMLRRVAGGVTAPFLTPGVSGLAQGLNAIPLVGGMAAGALNTAQGYYSQAVGLDQARLRNLYFAPKDLGQFVGTGPGRAAREALAKAQAQMQAADEQRGGRAGLARQAEQAALAEVAKTHKVSVRDEVRMQSQLQLLGVKGQVGAFGRSAQRGSNEWGQGTVLPHMRRRVDSAVAEDRAEARTALAAAEANMKGGGYRKGMRDDMTLGTDFGLDPTALQGAKGTYFGASGGLATDRAVRGRFQEALAAQTAFGIDLSQSGTFGRGKRAGGGMTGGFNLSAVLTTAVQQGLEGAQVSEYLGTLVQLSEEAEKTGVKINARDFVAGTGLLNAAGFQGLQGQRVGGGLSRKAMGVAAGGVQSPVDMLMLRAAGYSPDQGPEGYFKAREALEGGMKGKTLLTFLQMLTSGAQGAAGEYTQAGILKQAMGAGGAQIGSAQARGLLKAARDGTLTEKTLEGLNLPTDMKATRENVIGGAKGLVDKGASLAKVAAGQASQETAAGQGLASVFVALNQTVITNVGALKNFKGELQTVANTMLDVSKALKTVTGGGLAGIAEKLGLKGAFDAVVGAVR